MRLIRDIDQFIFHYMKSVQIRIFFWSVFFHIRTEYGEMRSISPYSVRMRENTDQKKIRIWTLFTQCFFFKLSIIPSKLPSTLITASCSISSMASLSKSSCSSINSYCLWYNFFLNFGASSFCLLLFGAKKCLFCMF